MCDVKSSDRTTAKRGLRAVTARIVRYVKDESGAMLVASLFFLLMILMVGGISVDLMRYEMERTRLQNTIDRAVLAAADLDQIATPEAVVLSYFQSAGLTETIPVVTKNVGIGTRWAKATATQTIDTQFLRMTGIETLDVVGAGAAREDVPNVEISLVLDISGSMKDSNRLGNMQNAATEFVNTVLTASNNGRVSLSLIPYSEHVNIGQTFARRTKFNETHGYSYCLEFQDFHFNNAQIDPNYQYQHMQHFQWNYYSIESGYAYNTLYDTVCPRNSYEEVTPLSQDRSALISQINSLKPRAGTAIHLGMKWAAALLDPSTRPLLGGMTGADQIDSAFRNSRPADYTAEQTLKTIVLMTDGENSSSSRISSSYYANSSHWNHWNNHNFNGYLYRYVNYYQRPYWYYQKYTNSKGNQLLNSVCNAAKAQGIIIWTIGFEVTNNGANVMKSCASSDSHFFRVEGIEISSAFSSIASQLNQLKLIE